MILSTLVLGTYFACNKLMKVFEKSEMIKSDEIIGYCKKNSVNKSKKFYQKEMGDYIYVLALTDNMYMYDEFYIFKRSAKYDNYYEDFGGVREYNDSDNMISNKEEKKQKDNYCLYMATFTDRKGEYDGLKCIYFSENLAKIEKLKVKIKENNIEKDIEYEIDKKDPFIIVVENLGEINGVTREIIGEEAFDDKGNVVSQDN